jgi:hypothetical protein
MPRRIDYVGRFEFIRQAAFAVVRDDGVEALSRRRVAAELGTGVNTIRRSVADWAELACLAADQVRSRRRAGRLGRRTGEPMEAVEVLVRSLMPENPTHVDEELVWLKLVAACSLRPSGLEPPGQVRHEFGIAQRGYDDGIPMTDEDDADVVGRHLMGRPAARRAALERYVTEREEDLTVTVDRVLTMLDVDEGRADAASTLVALVEGLTLSVCLGRLTPERATELAIAHAMSLAA